MQWLPFTLQFPIAKAGTTVMLGCLDGGRISATTPQGQVVLSTDGTTPDPILTVSADGNPAPV